MNCGRCGYRRYQQSTAPFPYPNGRPRFTCLKCQHQWTAGHDGGEYTEHAEPAKQIDTKVLYFRIKEMADESPLKAAVGVCRSDVATVAEHYEFDTALAELEAAGFLTPATPEPGTEYARERLIETFGSVPPTLYRVSFDPWDDTRLEPNELQR